MNRLTLISWFWLLKKTLVTTTNLTNPESASDKTLKTSLKVMDMELKEGKRIQECYERYSREYTLQEEDKSSSYLWVCSVKTSGRLLFSKEKPKKSFERFVVPSEEYITQHKSFTCVFKIKKMRGTVRKFVPRKASWRQCKEWFQYKHQEVYGDLYKRCLCQRVLGQCERGFTSGYRQDVWVGQKAQEDRET